MKNRDISSNVNTHASFSEAKELSRLLRREMANQRFTKHTTPQAGGISSIALKTIQENQKKI